MQNILITILLSIILLAGCSRSDEKHENDQESNGSGKKPETPVVPKKEIWTCSMHPQIRQDKPGDCPICGMTLVPAKENVNQVSQNQDPASTAKATVSLMPSQESVASIKTIPVKSGPYTREIQFFGDIKYVQDNHLDLTSFYPGRVEKVLISYNTTSVSKGQPLLEIYSEDVINEQEKYLEALRQRYLTTFYERKIVTAKIQTIKEKLLKGGLTEEDLESLVKENKVKKTIIIKAAQAGSIVGQIPHVGERITQESVIFHIAPLGKVWFAARVFEADMTSLKPGQKASIETKARPGKTYEGKLVFIDRILDPTNRTVLARFEIDNPKQELLPEMSATGKIQSGDSKTYILIPSSAVIDTGLRKLVYVKTGDSSYDQREVKVSETTSGQSETMAISSGLSNGEEVVTSGAFLLDAEAELRGLNSASQPEHQH